MVVTCRCDRTTLLVTLASANPERTRSFAAESSTVTYTNVVAESDSDSSVRTEIAPAPMPRVELKLLNTVCSSAPPGRVALLSMPNVTISFTLLLRISVTTAVSVSPPSLRSMQVVWASLEANPLGQIPQIPYALTVLPKHTSHAVESAFGPVPGAQLSQAFPSNEAVVVEQGVQVSEYCE